MTAAMSHPEPDVLAERRVAPGVLAVPIAIEGSGLRHVFVYALECDCGVLLVDAGWAGEQSLDRLEQGLATMGRSIADVIGVVVTHNHSDHYGLAGRIRAESGAWIGMHPADAAQLDLRYGSREQFQTTFGAWLRRCGVPDDRLGELSSATMYGEGIDTSPPDRLLVGGDRLRVGGWRLDVIHTPGHSPGHLTFSAPGEGLFFAGDHVLPRITPNVSAGPLGGPDPLRAYLSSLSSVRDLDGVQVLPAHVAPFEGLAGRVDELVAHHERRLDETVQCLAAGAGTVWEVAADLSWSRPLDRFPAFLQRAALGEAEAHLQQLARDGRAVADDRGSGFPLRWRVTGADEEQR
jgi:glyoxylase-like metal-dependent hydrolase (beta-lactamase superfamily II)